MIEILLSIVVVVLGVGLIGLGSGGFALLKAVDELNKGYEKWHYKTTQRKN